MMIPAVGAQTRESVQERGRLVCGVEVDLPGFSMANSLGEYSGFDIDLCRAVASAVLDDPMAVDFLPASEREGFEALRTGEVDLLSRSTIWNLETDVAVGEFVAINFHDSQGFMVRVKTGIRSVLELDNQPLCITRGTNTELQTAEFFVLSQLRYKPVYFDDERASASAYATGQCVAFTGVRSRLASQRADFEQPDAHTLLPESISKQPRGPMVGGRDPVWTDIVRWSLNCMINAEELGVDSTNVDTAFAVSTPAGRRLLGAEGSTGALLGLSDTWCAGIIRDVGNYAESYGRNLGGETAVAMERGINELWTNGGLLYAPPM